MASKKYTLTNPNACVNHVMTVNGLVQVGPGATVEVEVPEDLVKAVDNAIEGGVYTEAKTKAKAEDAKTDAKK
jgi:hypothetical protein